MTGFFGSGGVLSGSSGFGSFTFFSRFFLGFFSFGSFSFFSFLAFFLSFFACFLSSFAAPACSAASNSFRIWRFSSEIFSKSWLSGTSTCSTSVDSSSSPNKVAANFAKKPFFFLDFSFRHPLFLSYLWLHCPKRLLLHLHHMPLRFPVM